MKNNNLCLKYRPFQLNDIVGQKFVVATLKQASIQDNFYNSYIFSGNKGCGKTTTARILANLLTCENPKDGVLCGECTACKSIHKGFSMDISEMDGAAKGSKEEVVKLIDSARYSPSELKRKVYIIDECHQLSGAAISALLKIVEEPPEYLHFVFCTTELNKIPATILSRSQRFNFGKIMSKEVVGRLKVISSKEDISIDDESLFELAKLGRGSMRDSIAYLQQIATVAAGKPITAKHIQKYFGLSDRLAFYNMVEAMIGQNYALLMDQVNDLVVASVDVKSILYEISEVFRGIMVLKAQKGKVGLIDLPDNEIEKMNKLGESIKLSQLDQLSRTFANVNKELDYGINERWVLETTLIRCASMLKT